MVNVFIIGATGNIGSALCGSLLRAGSHRVYGLARSPQKAVALAAAKVIPIIGSLADIPAIFVQLNQYRIDVIVDLSGDRKGTTALLGVLTELGAARQAGAERAGVRIPKLGFIYCSGTWVRGSSPLPVNDLFPVGTHDAPTLPVRLTAWRAKLEQDILASAAVLEVMIVRPALVYGRSYAIWTSLFDPIEKAVEGSSSKYTVTLNIHPESRPGLVHVDDVASGFHAAIDKLPLISGIGVYPVFDLVTSQESMSDILKQAATELKFLGDVQMWGPKNMDGFSEALSTTANLNSGRARMILGWEPKKFGFVKYMDIYVQSWLASSPDRDRWSNWKQFAAD